MQMPTDSPYLSQTLEWIKPESFGGTWPTGGLSPSPGTGSDADPPARRRQFAIRPRRSAQSW